MFGLFTRHKWTPETVAEMHGTYRDLSVTLRNVPCLREEHGSVRKFASPDFGLHLLNELHEQLGSMDALASRLNAGAPACALITLSGYQPVSVELRGKLGQKAWELQSDIADALLEAFKSVGLRRS